jgi:hypothetical protein
MVNSETAYGAWGVAGLEAMGRSPLSGPNRGVVRDVTATLPVGFDRDRDTRLSGLSRGWGSSKLGEALWEILTT